MSPLPLRLELKGILPDRFLHTYRGATFPAGLCMIASGLPAKVVSPLPTMFAVSRAAFAVVTTAALVLPA